MVDQMYGRIDRVAEVVRRNIGRHSNGNTVGSVYQEVRITARQNNRLFLLAIEVRDKVYRIFINITQHLQGEMTHSRLCVTLRGGAISVNRSEVSVSVYERIAHGKILRHADHCVIN